MGTPLFFDRHWIAVVFLVFLFFTSCSKQGADEEDIKETILHFDNALISAYNADDFVGLREYALPGEIERTRKTVEELRKEGKRLVSSVKDITFEEIKITGDKARVATNEFWYYEYVSTNDGSIVEPKVESEYKMTYYLAKKDNKWFIAGGEGKERIKKIFKGIPIE